MKHPHRNVDPVIQALHEISNPDLALTEATLTRPVVPVDVDRSRPAAGLEALSLGECKRLLSSHYVGRVAFVNEGQVLILPVNYAMVDEDIVIRTDPGSKLRAAARGAMVAFEIDHSDALFREGWSVVVQGRLGVVNDPELSESMKAVPLRPFAEGERSTYLCIVPTRITGRRLSRPPVAMP